MPRWDPIRAIARARRAEVISGKHDPHSLLSAESLLDLCERATGVLRLPLEEGDPLLYGAEALLYTESGESIIYYNDSVSGWLTLFYQAHEYGHYWLRHTSGDPKCQSTDVDVEAFETVLPVGVQTVQGYGPKERREREANVFARELLLPTDSLRKWYVEQGMDAYRIASAVGVPITLVYHQLAYALLAPTPSSESQVSSPKFQVPGEDTEQNDLGLGTRDLELALDPSQKQAAHAKHGPLLIEAGPGTGKTRTLTARIAYLLEKGIAPTSILALTFSNKAADEMRSRVAVMAPEAAPQIWMGTFHSFGLELLSKYGTRIGLPAKVNIVDPVDALLALERKLPELRLHHYMNLYEPTTHLSDILSAISRAKDELVGPEQYAELAQAMHEDAADPDELEHAEKAAEVARVYKIYQSYLEREGLVDFGDLIFKAVTLLREHPDVRQRVRNIYSDVLVDEFQDINRASGILLHEVAGDGQGLWVVGDARQAIYRFRGAAPSNMRLFRNDYPAGKVMPLEANYRSQPVIVSTVAELAPRMRATAGMGFTPWQPQRSANGGKVILEIAGDEIAEARGIADLILAHHAEGVPYKEQAVLCRSHTNLERIGAVLEQKGVPVLYLGDLFERPEVRDLLALLHLASGEPAALVRVARFPEYDVPLADVQAVIAMSRLEELSILEAIDRAAVSDQIMDGGKIGLSLLSVHLEVSIAEAPWKMLVQYLFGASGYLKGMIADGSVAVQQRRLAIFQFLQFAHEQESRISSGDVDPKLQLLEYVRRLEIFGKERELRQVPEWAAGVDAVRMLTVHASKGLEFSAVYVPFLANGFFPTRRRGMACPPPTGMLSEGEDGWHEEEEECLFFVALSRARDILCLSRSQKYGRSNSKPSRLLTLIQPRLSRPPDGPVSWMAASLPDGPDEPTLPEIKPRFFARLLELYMECPRQFYYEYKLSLRGNVEDAAYLRFTRSVYRAINHLRDEQEAGRLVSAEEALAKLAEIWAEEGMTGHVHEEIYYAQAQEMLKRAIDRRSRARGPLKRPDWEVPLPYGRVAFTPDQTELVEDGTNSTLRVQRFRTGRATGRDKELPLYALYHAAAARAYPDAKRLVQAIYLATDEIVDILLTDKQLESGLDKYNQALAGILAGDFHPEPDSRRCPRCPYYFVCPS